jgi:hypothetical protein
MPGVNGNGDDQNELDYSEEIDEDDEEDDDDDNNNVDDVDEENENHSSSKSRSADSSDNNDNNKNTNDKRVDFYEQNNHFPNNFYKLLNKNQLNLTKHQKQQEQLKQDYLDTKHQKLSHFNPYILNSMSQFVPQQLTISTTNDHSNKFPQNLPTLDTPTSTSTAQIRNIKVENNDYHSANGGRSQSNASSPSSSSSSTISSIANTSPISTIKSNKLPPPPPPPSGLHSNLFQQMLMQETQSQQHQNFLKLMSQSAAAAAAAAANGTSFIQNGLNLTSKATTPPTSLYQKSYLDALNFYKAMYGNNLGATLPSSPVSTTVTTTATDGSSH